MRVGVGLDKILCQARDGEEKSKWFTLDGVSTLHDGDKVVC